MSTPQTEALLAAINERVRQLSYLGETMSDSEGEEFQQGFEAGAKWKQTEIDRLAKENGLLTATLEAADAGLKTYMLSVSAQVALIDLELASTPA